MVEYSDPIDAIWALRLKKKRKERDDPTGAPQRDEARRKLTRLGASTITWPQLYVIVMMSSQHIAGVRRQDQRV